MKKLRILPNYTYGFSRWIGSPLSPRHKAIIEHLERSRLQASIQSPLRVIVEDSDPGTSGIPQLLALYLQWIATRIIPHRRAAIVNTTISATHPLLEKAKETKGIRLCSARRPTALRGQSLDLILMLNCHSYTRRGPFASRGDDFYLYGVDNFSDLLRVILPMLPQHHESMLIIHGRPNRRVTGFQSLRRKTIAGLTAYTLITPASLPDPIIKRLISPIRPISPIPFENLKDLIPLKDSKAPPVLNFPPPPFIKVA